MTALRERLGRSSSDTRNVVVPDERPLPGFVRVDLLPDSVRDRARIRRAKRIALLLVLLALVIVAGLWYYWQQQVRNAEAELAAAQATGAQIAEQSAQYAEVPQVFASAEAAQGALTAAMSGEVRWAFLLNQLSFATPSGVTLTSIQGTLAEGGTTQSSPGGVLPAEETVGTMVFGGQASSFREVAAWLDSLQTLKDYTYPFLTNTSKDTESGSIEWESNAGLSPNALSGRYGTPPPAQDEASTPQSQGESGSPNPQPDDGAEEVS